MSLKQLPKNSQQYRTRHSVKFHDFSFSNFDIFRRENDVIKFAPNFAFSIMGYCLTVFRKTCYKDLKIEKRYNVSKFEFPVFCEDRAYMGLNSLSPLSSLDKCHDLAGKKSAH